MRRESRIASSAAATALEADIRRNASSRPQEQYHQRCKFCNRLVLLVILPSGRKVALTGKKAIIVLTLWEAGAVGISHDQADSIVPGFKRLCRELNRKHRLQIEWEDNDGNEANFILSSPVEILQHG